MYHYVQSFTNNEVGGKQLLNIRPYELEQLGMLSIGHQEIVLEAVEYLKNFVCYDLYWFQTEMFDAFYQIISQNYNLDKENLQFLALHVASASQSLSKQLKYSDQTKLETQILKDITRTVAALKPLIGWLDRVPFRGTTSFWPCSVWIWNTYCLSCLFLTGQKQFDELRTRIMQLGLEMATMAMRDRFSVKPVESVGRTGSPWLETVTNNVRLFRRSAAPRTSWARLRTTSSRTSRTRWCCSRPRSSWLRSRSASPTWAFWLCPAWTGFTGEFEASKVLHFGIAFGVYSSIDPEATFQFNIKLKLEQCLAWKLKILLLILKL